MYNKNNMDTNFIFEISTFSQIPERESNNTLSTLPYYACSDNSQYLIEDAARKQKQIDPKLVHDEGMVQ